MFMLQKSINFFYQIQNNSNYINLFLLLVSFAASVNWQSVKSRFSTCCLLFL